MVCTANVASGPRATPRAARLITSAGLSPSSAAAPTASPSSATVSSLTAFGPPGATFPASALAPAAQRVQHVTTAAAAAAAAAEGSASRRPAAVVLGIESSCDDTGVAVVTSDGRVLGEAIATQADVHAQWGGVVPNLARDAHAAAIDRTVDSALAAAGLAPQQLSAVAVTIGPGLGLCLRVGAAKARQIARQYGIPLVSVHHMEAHALVARLPSAAAAAAPPAVRMAATATTAAAPAAETHGSSSPGSSPPQQLLVVPQSPEAAHHSAHEAVAASSSDRAQTLEVAAADSADPATVLADIGASVSVPFPFLCLLVSGGHNLLVLVRGVGKYVQLGTTVDDALGEAYDKIARLLNLELRPHGGAALEALAREGDPRAVKFAVPMRKYATCDFSFAGLKTNTRLAIEQQLAPERTACLTPEELRKVKADIAASFQAVAVTHLTEKTRRGVGWAREVVPELRHLVVAGGVACNQVVRGSLQQLAENEGLELVLPPPRWCTDNGVMVAWAGIERLALGWAEPPPPTTTNPTQRPAPAPASTASTSTTDVAPGGDAAERPVSSPPPPPQAEGQQQEQQPQAGSRAGEEAEAEWIELKPRWPLTSELHPRSAAAQQEQRRSVRRVRLHTPLSDLAPPGVAAAAAADAGGVAPGGSGGAATTTAAQGTETGTTAAGPDAAGLGPAEGGAGLGREAAVGAGVEANSLVGAGV
ncbi:glutamated carboxypeptidase [Pleodorina starrii]|nr:glutamated carboxypeptidase [Pleodorina starrii]